jgi:DNA-binding transcriptional ArsR family regulator
MSRSPLRFDRLAALDKTIHEPARLAILSALSACQSASFTFLLALTGLTQGNLHVHLAKLKSRGLIEIEKGYAGGYSSTSVQLTALGRKAITQHWDQLAALKHVAAQLGEEVPEETGAISTHSRKRASR